MPKLDVYLSDNKVQSSVDSPINFDGLTPDTEYSYEVAYAGKSEKTAFSFKTKAAINIPVTGVAMPQQTLSLKVGATKQLVGVISPDNATNKNMTYSSENEAIATVASDGTITAVAPGTVNVVVTTADGSFTDKTAVTVTE